MKTRTLSRTNSAASVTWPKAFREEVGRLKNPRAALQSLRTKLPVAETPKLFAQLRSNPLFTTAVAANAKPRRFKDLGASPRMRTRGLIADLAWAGETIMLFSSSVKTLLAIETDFENAWLINDFDTAHEILDNLENEFGISLWLINKRIALLRSTEIDSATDYASSLIAESSASTVNAWLVYMMAYRADPNVSPSAYLRIIEEALGRADLTSSTHSHIRYFGLNSPPHGRAAAGGLLVSAENLPLVDRYIALLDAMQSLACDAQLEVAERRILAELASRLNAALPDYRLQLLNAVLDPTGTQELISRVDPNIADAYTRGEYATALANIELELSRNPHNTNLFSIASRALARSDAEIEAAGNIPIYIRHMAEVQSFSDNATSAAVSLMREALVGAHRPFTATIRSLFSSSSSDPTDSTTDVALEALNGRNLTPLQLRSLPVADRAALLEAAIEAHPSSIALKLQRAVLDFGNSILGDELRTALPPDREALYSARAYSRLGKHDEAIELLLPYVEHAVAPVANDARRELFKAYQSGKYREEALRLAADSYRRNSKLHALFRVSELLDEIEADGRQPPFAEIALSIAYHIANRFDGDKRAGAEADAAEEYALSQGVDLPSKIDPGAVEGSGELFNVYLDKVCVPPVLDKFMAIENVSQVESERLEICRLLSERDPAGRQRYLDEIQEITRRRVVRERFEQVERTKIYVDTEGVKRQAEKTLRDTYSRYVTSLADDREGSERLRMMRKVQELLSEIDAEGVRIHFSDLPANERERMFERLVHSFMVMLISSQEYGLEAYLSTRVRHGTMGNQLRSALEIHSLITQRDNGVYQPDDFWPEAMDLGYNPLAGWLSNRLARFSEAVDAAIEELVRSRVQVRSESCPKGLFVFQSFNYDVIRLESEITPDTSFDDFADKVIDQFWTVLEMSLSTVRRYIEVDFLHELHKLIDDLERDVLQELASINSSLIRSAIAAARTQVSIIIANVANWFTLARDMERPDYEFGVAVEVATESIRACHPSLDIQLKRSDDLSFECRGRSLESLVYLLFTALDNAIAHSGFHESAPDVILSTHLADDVLEMTLTNTCHPIHDFNSKNDHLKMLRERLNAEESGKSLATTEGGSGYAKIIRILKHDLLARFHLDFGYISNTEYSVKIGIEAKAIVK